MNLLLHSGRQRPGELAARSQPINVTGRMTEADQISRLTGEMGAGSVTLIRVLL